MQGGDPRDDGLLGRHQIFPTCSAADRHQRVQAEPGDIGKSAQGDRQLTQVVDVEGREYRRHSHRDIGSSQLKQAPEGRGRRPTRLLLHLWRPVKAHPDTHPMASQHGDHVAIEVGGIGLYAAGDPPASNGCDPAGDVLDEVRHQGRLPAGQLDVGRPTGAAHAIGDEIQCCVRHLDAHPAAPAVSSVAVGAGEVTGGGGPQHEVADGHDRLLASGGSASIR